VGCDCGIGNVVDGCDLDPRHALSPAEKALPILPKPLIATLMAITFFPLAALLR
jgi:hypothetical protein